jgi:hypothetical protein
MKQIITPKTPLRKIKPLKATIYHDGQGYPHFYMPTHPLARQNGMVSLSRHTASLKKGRWLGPEELVRHKDGDPANTHPNNLKVVTRQKNLRANGINQENQVVITCAYCQQNFSVPESHAGRRKHCSTRCRDLNKRKFEIEPEKLARWVWEEPVTQVAKALGVSDNAVRKRCRKFGIPTPPRGYWTLVKRGCAQKEAIKQLGLEEEIQL